MHYLTLQKLNNRFNTNEDREIIKNLDEYLYKNFKKTGDYNQRIAPFYIIDYFQLDNEKAQKLIYFIRVATELKMFSINYEAYCPSDGGRFLGQVKDINNHYFVECCKWCGEEHEIAFEDFIITYKLEEKPIEKDWWNLLFKRVA